MKVDIELSVSGNTKETTVLVVEHLKFTSRIFRFINGEWIRSFKNFPITTDDFFDFGLLAGGIPGQKCKVKAKISYSGKTINKEFEDEFDGKGWAILRGKIQLA